MFFGKRGGSTVKAGTYWNFSNGEKCRLEQAGMLPGKSSQTFYRLPPLLILAAAAAAAHVFMYVLPSYLVRFYEAHTEKLVTTYVLVDFIAIGVVLLGLSAAVLADIFGLRFKVPSFNWNPAESYLAGKRTEVPVRIEDDTEK